MVSPSDVFCFYDMTDRATSTPTPRPVAASHPGATPTRVAPDRAHTLSGRDDLAWFFQHRRWMRSKSGPVSVDCCWATRPKPAGEPALRMLFLATKRDHRRAHDRNRMRRWMRAAVLETPALAALEQAMQARELQLLVMFRISRPRAEVAWANVQAAVAEHAAFLTTKCVPIVPTPAT